MYVAVGEEGERRGGKEMRGSGTKRADWLK